AADRDAGGRRSSSSDRRRAAQGRHAIARPRRAARARPAGVGPQRRARRPRDHVHLTARDRGGPCRRRDRDRARARARPGAGDPARTRERPQRDARRASLRLLRARAPAFVIVRWGLSELPAVLAELRIGRPLLVASDRWANRSLGVRPAARWTEVPSDQVAAAAEHAGDGVVAVGGGSAIDLGKAISAEAEVPIVSVPTTYAGAEWTPYFGIRDPGRRMKGGGSGAHLRGVV